MKNIDKQHIVSQLEHFGCIKNEAELYIYSLSVGPETIQKLAQGLKRNRTTVYNEVQQLLKKGLFFETRKDRKRYVAAERPGVLYSLLQQRENELAVLKNNMNYAVGILDAIKPTDTGIPTVKIYEGVDGFKKMFEETLTAKNEVLVINYVELFSKLIGPDYLENYFKRRSAKGIRGRHIFADCDFAERINKKAAEYKVNIHLTPAGMEWKAGIYSWNDCLGIQSFTEGKMSCVVIENKDIAEFYRKVIFELAWAQTKEM